MPNFDINSDIKMMENSIRDYVEKFKGEFEFVVLEIGEVYECKVLILYRKGDAEFEDGYIFTLPNTDLDNQDYIVISREILQYFINMEFRYLSEKFVSKFPFLDYILASLGFIFHNGKWMRKEEFDRIM